MTAKSELAANMDSTSIPDSTPVTSQHDQPASREVGQKRIKVTTTDGRQVRLLSVYRFIGLRDDSNFAADVDAECDCDVRSADATAEQRAGRTCRTHDHQTWLPSQAAAGTCR